MFTYEVELFVAVFNTFPFFILKGPQGPGGPPGPAGARGMVVSTHYESILSPESMLDMGMCNVTESDWL